MGMRMCFMLLSLCVYFVGIPASYSSNSVFNIKNEASGSSSLAGDVANVIHQSHLNFMNLKGRSSSADNIKLAVVFLPDVDKEYGTNDANAKNILFEKTCSPSEWPISASEITKDIYEGCIWNRGGEPCRDADGEHYSCWSCQNGWTPVSPSFRLGGGCVAVDLDCHAHKLSEQMDTSKGGIEKRWSRGEEVWCYTNCNTEDGWIAKHDNKGYISDCVANDCSDYPMDGSNITCIDGNRKLCGGKPYIFCKSCINGYKAVNGICVADKDETNDDDNDDDDLLTKLLKRFRKIINFSENGETEKVLRKQFQRATSQNLRTRNNFPVALDYFGKKEDKDLALEVMASWLFAMTLTEVDPSKRDELYRVGYVVGKDEPTYGRSFDSDLNIARLTASAIYAKNHDFDEVKRMRAEIGSSPVNYKPAAVRANGVTIDLTLFMPSAPGPYDPDKSNRNANGGYPGGAANADHNLVQDQQIHDYIVKNYNLPNQRTIQAVADKELNEMHLFGKPRTVTDEKYGAITFYPVFGKHNIGVEINPDGYIARLASYIGYDCDDNRKPFRDAQLGRRRPGKDKSGAEAHLYNYNIDNGDGAPVRNETRGVYDSNATALDAGESSTSYPSGHSAYAWCTAMVLAELMPDKTEQIMRAANEFALSRTLVRAHWTSDTIHGRVVASSFLPIANANMMYTECGKWTDSKTGELKSCFDKAKEEVNQGSTEEIKGIDCELGDIYYSDNTCNSEVVAGKTPIGIVFHLNYDTSVVPWIKTGAYIVSLEEAMLQWGTDSTEDIAGLKNLSEHQYFEGESGYTNTKTITEAKGKHPAAEYCANYSVGGKAWYLPNGTEMNNLLNSYAAYVTPSLSKTGGTPIGSGEAGRYWTSSESDVTGRSYIFNVNYHPEAGLWTPVSKTESHPTRCIFKAKAVSDEPISPVMPDVPEITCGEGYKYSQMNVAQACTDKGGKAIQCEYDPSKVACDCTGLSSSKIGNCKTHSECPNTLTNTTYYKCDVCEDGYEPNSTGTECVKKEETCDVNQYPYGGEQIVSKCTDHGGKNEACKKADNVWRHGCHCEDSTFSTKKSVANCKIYDTCTDTFKNNTEYYKCTKCEDGYELKGGACYEDPCNSCSGDACCHCKCGSDYSYAGSNWCSRTVPATTAPAGETWIGDKNSSGSWKCQTKNPEEDETPSTTPLTSNTGLEQAEVCSKTFSMPKRGGSGYSASDAGYSEGCQKAYPYDAREGDTPTSGQYCLKCKTGYCADPYVKDCVKAEKSRL